MKQRKPKISYRARTFEQKVGFLIWVLLQVRDEVKGENRKRIDLALRKIKNHRIALHNSDELY